MTDQEAYIAFNLTSNVGSVKVAAMSEHFGGVVPAWEQYSSKVSRDGGEVDVEGELSKAKRYGVGIITPADENYPKRLLRVESHPLALYVKGSLAALERPTIGIVGTRRATQYGIDQANRLAGDLARAGWTVISGLAVGIDRESHRAALEAGGLTIGVLGSALDCFYPEENRQLAREMVNAGGAVISEFPFGHEPDQHTFPQRNHVVAALSDGVIAVEAPSKSGTLITAAFAAELGRTVMAVPAKVDNRMSVGCLKLIRDGARLVRNADDVLEEMSELLPKSAEFAASSKIEESSSLDEERREEVALSVEEAKILRNLDEEGVSMDCLADRTGLPPGRLSALCMALRLKGRLRYLPGNRISLPRSR